MCFLLVHLFLAVSVALCHVGPSTCYVDTPSRVLGQGNVNSDGASLYNEYCAWLCFKLNFSLAGSENSNECYCGNQLVRGQQNMLRRFLKCFFAQVSGVQKAPSGDCNAPCLNYPNETCGGAWRLQVLALLLTRIAF